MMNQKNNRNIEKENDQNKAGSEIKNRENNHERMNMNHQPVSANGFSDEKIQVPDAAELEERAEETGLKESADNCRTKWYRGQNAVVEGDVLIGKDCSIWHNAVIRADSDQVVIGDASNVQDGAVIHVDEGFPVEIGKNVSIGHNAIIHGCTIGDNTIIGMGAIILNGAVIGQNVLIGAGALVGEGKAIEDGTLVIGLPGKMVRKLSEAEIEASKKNAAHYVEAAKKQLSLIEETDMQK